MPWKAATIWGEEGVDLQRVYKFIHAYKHAQIPIIIHPIVQSIFLTSTTKCTTYINTKPSIYYCSYTLIYMHRLITCKAIRRWSMARALSPSLLLASPDISIYLYPLHTLCLVLSPHSPSLCVCLSLSHTHSAHAQLLVGSTTRTARRLSNPINPSRC